MAQHATDHPSRPDAVTLLPATVRTAGLLWGLAPIWYVGCEAIAAAAFDGYDYSRFYISDLGVAEHAVLESRRLASALPQVMNAGFIGTGLLFLVGLLLVVPHLRRSAVTAVFTTTGVLHVVGITFVGLVQGSPTNVANGLIVVHGLGAVAAIVGGNATAILSFAALRPLLPARRARLVGIVLGILGLSSGLLMSTHQLVGDGVWERGAVYPFLLWQCAVGWALQRSVTGHLAPGSALRS